MFEIVCVFTNLRCDLSTCRVATWYAKSMKNRRINSTEKYGILYSGKNYTSENYSILEILLCANGNENYNTNVYLYKFVYFYKSSM